MGPVKVTLLSFEGRRDQSDVMPRQGESAVRAPANIISTYAES